MNELWVELKRPQVTVPEVSELVMAHRLRASQQQMEQLPNDSHRRREQTNTQNHHLER